MGADQSWGKVFYDKNQYIQNPDNAKVVKIFREETDGLFYYKKFDGTVHLLFNTVGDSLWEIGSSGSFSLKPKGTSGCDAIADFALAEGEGSLASGIGSHAEGKNTISLGDYSHAEGESTSAEAKNSHAGGINANASNYGEWARGGSDFGQYGFVCLKASTIGAQKVEFLLDDGNKFLIPVNQSYRLNMDSTIISSIGDSAEFKSSGLIKNIAGVTSLVSPINMPIGDNDASLALTTIDVSADDATDSLKIQANGVVGVNIKWIFRIFYLSIKI